MFLKKQQTTGINHPYKQQKHQRENSRNMYSNAQSSSLQVTSVKDCCAQTRQMLKWMHKFGLKYKSLVLKFEKPFEQTTKNVAWNSAAFQEDCVAQARHKCCSDWNDLALVTEAETDWTIKEN